MKISLFVASFMLALCVHLSAETFADSSITFTYPAHWRQSNINDSGVVFNVDTNFIFRIEHAYGYDGDEFKLAEHKKAQFEKLGGKVTIENSAVGNVFAVKMICDLKLADEPIRYISYLYRDRRAYNEDPVAVSTISYGGKTSDFEAMEPQCLNVYKSIKWKTRTAGKPGKYHFEYPVSCTVKEFSEHSLYVTTNAPIVKNNGALLQGFFIGETPPQEKANIDSAVILKTQRLRYEGYINIITHDTIVGGKPGKLMHYQSTDTTNKLLMYVALHGSLYWFSFDPPKEAEKNCFYEAADLIMSTFKFED